MAEMTNTTKVQMQTAPKQNDFPTETIELPSQGLVYPEGHPLRKGTIEIKYMTAREEDILASQNLIKKGIVNKKNMSLYLSVLFFLTLKFYDIDDVKYINNFYELSNKCFILSKVF